MVMEPPVRLTTPPDVLEWEVTEDDIACGERNNPFNCANAVAINRQFDASSYVSEFSVRVYFRDGSSVRYATSADLSDWIDNFDAKRPVKPTRFRLERKAA